MDMLMNLKWVASNQSIMSRLEGGGFEIRRAMAYERSAVVGWVQNNFNHMWADECAVAFGRTPIGCHIAVKDDDINGFCCLHTTFINFIGPIGVHPACRRQGVGHGLMISVARELFHAGYAYAIIGDVGAPEFFKKSTGAWEIPDSTPGAYPRKIS